MPVPPKTLEELRDWVESHHGVGAINGQSIVPSGTKEFTQGFVPGNLYDRALLYSVPFGYKKSDIVITGATRLLANAYLDSAVAGYAIDFASYTIDSGTEFRAYLPTGLYDLVQAKKRELNWTNSQMMTTILSYFVFDPGIEKIYRNWIAITIATLSCTEAEIEKAVWDRRRYQARVKRLELSERKGELVRDRKIAT